MNKDLYDIYSEVYDKYGYLDQHVVIEMLQEVKKQFKCRDKNE